MTQNTFYKTLDPLPHLCCDLIAQKLLEQYNHQLQATFCPKTYTLMITIKWCSTEGTERGLMFLDDDAYLWHDINIVLQWFPNYRIIFEDQCNDTSTGFGRSTSGNCIVRRNMWPEHVTRWCQGLDLDPNLIKVIQSRASIMKAAMRRWKWPALR